jgi:hypothetical protein
MRRITLSVQFSDFDPALRQTSFHAAKAADDEFIPSAGVYRGISTGFFVCPRCLSDNKRSLMVDEARGYRCPVCEGYFSDQGKERAALRQRSRKLLIALMVSRLGIESRTCRLRVHGWLSSRVQPLRFSQQLAKLVSAYVRRFY